MFVSENVHGITFVITNAKLLKFRIWVKGWAIHY